MKKKKDATVRTTYLVFKALDINLELYAAMNGLKKNEVVEQALSDFLKSKGLEPDKIPTKLVY